MDSLYVNYVISVLGKQKKEVNLIHSENLPTCMYK